MYERSVDRNLARFEFLARVSLLSGRLGFCFRLGFGSFFAVCIRLVDPIVDCDSTFGVLLYFVRQLQVWCQSLPQYVVECRGADAQLLCHPPLFFVITFHPFCKLIHLTLFSNVFMDKNTESRYVCEHTKQTC